MIIFILLSFYIFSCQNEEIKYNEIIIENNQINSQFLSSLGNSERALITGYLYAYGNQCLDTSTNVKAKILKQLNIKNECDSLHLDFLSQWFKNDVILFYKLKSCPNLPFDSAIQNEIKEMSLHRHNDTLTISVLVYGLNNSQEKNWNSTQSETFVIKNNTFHKVKTNTNNQIKSNCISCQKNKQNNGLKTN